VRLAATPSALAPGSVEGIVARAAPIAALAGAPERVLLADAAHGGVDVATVEGFAREERAAVVATGRDGAAWALRVDPAGQAASVRVTPSAPPAPPP
jgi:hypothetical protein